jgi:circadian clock protein KaiC
VYGLEMHLAHMHRLITAQRPHAVVIDPVSSFLNAGAVGDTAAMLLRTIDYLKSGGITAMLVNLTSGGQAQESTEAGVSSLIDTWIVLRDIECGGERNRGLCIIKSRGMKHSNQIREFLITSKGIELQDVYVGPEGVLTGSLRAAQEARERAATQQRRQELERRQRELERRRAALEAQILALRHEFKSVEEEAGIVAAQGAEQERTFNEDRMAAALRRGGE